MKEKDTPQVHDIIRDCLTLVNSKDYPAKIIDYMLDYYDLKRVAKKQKQKNCLVAVTNGQKILGTITVRKNEILEVFVDPKNHSKGIGSKMMRRAEKIIKDDGHASIRLKSSLSAISFYEKIGYRKIKSLFSKNFGKTILMKKFIDTK